MSAARAKHFADVDTRERLVDELRRHLGVGRDGGRGALTVVVDGLEITVELTAARKLAGEESRDLLKQAIAYFEAEPWRIGYAALCGTSTTKKNPWGRSHRDCSKKVCGAVVSRVGDAIIFTARCRSHQDRAGGTPVGFVVLPPAELKRLQKLAEADYARRCREDDERERERERERRGVR